MMIIAWCIGIPNILIISWIRRADFLKSFLVGTLTIFLNLVLNLLGIINSSISNLNIFNNLKFSTGCSNSNGSVSSLCSQSPSLLNTSSCHNSDFCPKLSCLSSWMVWFEWPTWNMKGSTARNRGTRVKKREI